MQIQVHTDHNLNGGESLNERVETQLRDAVGRFAEQITRIEAHLGDENAKKGGQELLEGVSVAIERNGFGSQVESFEAPLEVDGLREPNRPFPGIFIRAPVRPCPWPCP